MPGTVHRWDEIGLVKITEMMSQKIVAGSSQMLAQTYLKQGALVPLHAHASEQMTSALEVCCSPFSTVRQCWRVLTFTTSRRAQCGARLSDALDRLCLLT